MKIRMSLIGSIGVVVLLSGCAVVAVPMLAASLGVTAWSGYKLVQTMSGGGTVEVLIDDKEVTTQQKSQLRQIKTLAIWPSPGSNSSVMFAEELTVGGRFQPVSPSRVSASLRRVGASESVDQMTSSELSEVSIKVCQEVGADGLIVAQQGAMESNMNMLSLQRAQMVQKGTVLVFKRGERGPILRLPVQLNIDTGGKSIDDKEVNRLAGKAIAKRLAELSS